MAGVGDVEGVSVAGGVLQARRVVGADSWSDGNDIAGTHNRPVGSVSFVPSDCIDWFSGRNEAPCFVVGRPRTGVAAGRDNGHRAITVLDADNPVSAVPIRASGCIS